MTPIDPAPEPDRQDQPCRIVESIEPDELLRPVDRQVAIYAEQKRQARGSFNLCILFAFLGALQALAGIVSVFVPWWVSRVGSSLLLGSGGLFAALSNQAFRLGETANRRLDRIAGDEKAREMIAQISDPKKRDEELSRFVRALTLRGK